MTRHLPLALLACAALWASVPPAQAAVSISSTEIVVSTPGASATINRTPFAMSFQDARGATVLREVANPGPAPLAIAGSENPPLLGHATSPGPTRYAPLTFTIGAASAVQAPASFEEGNQLAGVVAGVQYSAQAVTRAVADGAGGVTLTLATDDPSGRRLIVDVAPGPGAAITIRATPSDASAVATMGDSFASAGDEAFHGFGGRHNSLDERGQDFYDWLEEENFGAGGAQPGADATGGQGYLFPDGPTAAYEVQPLFISSRPYGFLLDQNELSRFRLDSDRPDAWQVAAEAPHLDYTVAPGDASNAIATLNAATGRERMPPAWAAATLMDRAYRATNGQTPGEVEAEVRSDVANIVKDHVPISGYRIEGWAKLSPAALASLISLLHAHGIHALLYFKAFVSTNQGDLDLPGTYQHAIGSGYVAKTSSGSPFLFGPPTIGAGTAALIDFSNPAAVAWWRGRVRAALDAGADGFMQDFGEQTLPSMQFADGENGATMHNRYPVLYDQATQEELDAYRAAHPGRQLWFFTRAGYTGSASSSGGVSPGSMAYDGGEFLGDGTTDWTASSGIASIIPDELNRSLGGAFGPTTDIGGYEDAISPPTTKELLIRWAQLAALTPFFRLHNSGNTGTQMPWNFDQEAINDYTAASNLHLAAEPYILKLWAHADRTGIPIMRPLWLTDPGDPVAARQLQEWTLGPDVLVAPVVTQGATSRGVYFPAGCWREPQTGAVYHGATSATVQAPLGLLPYFFSCGTTPFATPAAAPRVCGPTRVLRFKIRQFNGRVIRVRVYVGRKLIAERRGRRITSIQIKRPPGTTFTVRIIDTTTKHKTVETTRRYSGCRGKTAPHTTVRHH